MEVRPVRPADAPSWERLRQELWPAPAGEHAREVAAFFAGDRLDPLEAFLAIEDGEVAGFAEVSIRSHAEGCRPGRIAYLEGWFVGQEWRGRGVGAALLRAVEDWGRAQGCQELASDTEIDNGGSAAAHCALGFQEAARVICFRKDL